MKLITGSVLSTRGRFAGVVTSFLLTSFLSLNASAAVAPLEIIQPRSGLSTANRYYKAYPGLPYEVQVAAIGGTYPNKYELVSGPPGMTVNSLTGVILWTSPVVSASPYSATVRVTDADGAQATTNWTITVTTDGFRFVDAVNGKSAAQGGDGSRANPWRTIADWYITKYDQSYKGQFLYFRAGTYFTNAAPIEDGIRLAMSSATKPVVWLAYPGERPVIDVSGSHVVIYGGQSNIYFEGLEFRNLTTNFAVNINSAGSDNTVRNCGFRNLPASAGGAGTNASAIMISNGGAVGSRWAIVGNSFSDMYGQSYGILGYYAEKVLVEGNSFQNFLVRDSKAIGPKTNNSLWFIRDNRIDIPAGQGVWIDTYATTQKIEVAYNLVQTQADYALWVGQETGGYGQIESYRNTYIGGDVVVSNLSVGPVSFTDDVIVNNSGAANKITFYSSDSSRMTASGLLTGSMSSGIVDELGNLSGSYVQYVGTKGYQRADESQKPRAPTAVTAE